MYIPIHLGRGEKSLGEFANAVSIRCEHEVIAVGRYVISRKDVTHDLGFCEIERAGNMDLIYGIQTWSRVKKLLPGDDPVAEFQISFNG